MRLNPNATDHDILSAIEERVERLEVYTQAGQHLKIKEVVQLLSECYMELEKRGYIFN